MIFTLSTVVKVRVPVLSTVDRVPVYKFQGPCSEFVSFSKTAMNPWRWRKIGKLFMCSVAKEATELPQFSPSWVPPPQPLCAERQPPAVFILLICMVKVGTEPIDSASSKDWVYKHLWQTSFPPFWLNSEVTYLPRTQCPVQEFPLIHNRYIPIHPVVVWNCNSTKSYIYYFF